MQKSEGKTSEPVASRPFMPEYGLKPPEGGQGLLPWRWARDRLERAHNYWVATSQPDGRPHAMAVWGLWLEDAFYFSTGRISRKARNLNHNPNCVVTTENAVEAVIVEGVAELISEVNALDGIARLYQKKYATGYPEESNIYILRPRTVFGFIEHEPEFSGSSTRWQFRTG